MLERFIDWLKDRFVDDEIPVRPKFKKTGAPLSRAKPPRAHSNDSEQEPAKFEAKLSGTVESNGPGKNVFVSSKVSRDDSDQNESLKILDDTSDGGEESGIDPYNTGKFDRSQNWNSRNRK